MEKFVFAFMFLICSCSVGPDFKKPEIFSDEQIAKSLNLQNSAVYPQSSWYYAFNDQELNSLVDKAFEHNIDAKIAIARLKQARNSLYIAGVKYLPTFDASGKYEFSRASRNLQPTVDYNYFQTDFDVAWEFDIWGAGRRLSEEYEALFSAAGANVDGIKLSLTAEIIAQYINLRTAQEQLRITIENLSLQKKIFNIVSKKYQAGLSDDLAYNQSKYLLEQTASQIPEIKHTIETYKTALTSLIGDLPKDGFLELKGRNIIAQKFEFDTKNLYNYPVDSIRNRPDIKIAEYNLIAKNAAIGQAVANLYPKINISALAGYQAFSGHELFNSKSSAYGYNPAISLPVFHWGALIENIKLQENIYEEYLLTYQKTVINAVAEVKNAVDSIKNEYIRNDHLRKSFQNMQKVVYLTTRKYENGLTDFYQLLQAQQNLLKAQQDLSTSNGLIYLKIAAFYKATGVYPYNRSFSTDHPDSVPVACKQTGS